MSALEDLDAAKVELQKWEAAFDNYSGNNPDKFQADIRAARRRVRQLEDELKASGLMPDSERERLEQQLDRAFPNARSKEVVEFEGRRFQRRFYPLERSRSRKTVTEWGREWIELQQKESGQ